MLPASIKKRFTEWLAPFSKKERGFILFAMLSGFFICAEYAVIRPVSNSLFIHAFSTSYFPYAWIVSIPLNIALVSLYNKLVPKWGSRKLLYLFVFSVIGINTSCALLCPHFPGLSFFFYIWKECYILLMFQLLWSVIHANVDFKRARFLYGIFFGVGGLGSLVGSSFPGFFAISVGSENLLFLSAPIYLCLLLSYTYMCKHAHTTAPVQEESASGGFLHGLRLIRSSRLLIFALLIVVFMQMTSALIDFQFNEYLQQTFSLKDVRTEFTGRVFSIVHILTILLQFIGSYAIVRWIGIQNCHFLIPSFLGLTLCSFLLLPILPLITLAQISVKTFDFSLFGVVREMLYIPLKTDEKFRAKSIIDVFAHRTAKGLASLLILGFQFFLIGGTATLTFVTLGITLVWVGSASFGLKGYASRIQEKGN